MLLILIGLYVKENNFLRQISWERSSSTSGRSRQQRTAGWHNKAVHHGRTEHRSGQSWRLLGLRVSTRFEMKGGSQGMLARLVANGGQKSKQKQSYRHSKSHPSSLQSGSEKQTRQNRTSHTASSSHTVGQTRQRAITRRLRGWRGLRVTLGAQG